MQKLHNLWFGIWVIIVLITNPLEAQQSSQAAPGIDWMRNYYDRQYGADYRFMNGTRYFPLNAPYQGHPFYGENNYDTGSILMEGILYPDVQIKYDICNQQLLLKHDFEPGRSIQLVLRNEFIEEFRFGGKLFRKLFYEPSGERFYQVIEAGPLSCLFFDQKTLRIDQSSQYLVSYIYSGQKRKFFLVFDDKLYPFLWDLSFIRFFPKEHRKDIRTYMKQKKISIRQVTDKQMKSLLNHCVTLMNLQP